MEEQEKYEEVIEPVVEEKKESIRFQENLPNAGLVLTLGILSIPFCCCFILSLPLGIIGWVMGHKGVATYKANPNAYTRSSFSNMNAGRVCAIVGVVLTILYYAFVYMKIQDMGGWGAYMEMIREASEQYQ